MDLIEFLRARLDEDEAVARRAEPNQSPTDLRAMVTRDAPDQTFLVIDSARVLAEVDAKRRIIDIHGSGADPCDAHDASMRTIPCDTLLLLTLPYAEHPDYQAEWRV